MNRYAPVSLSPGPERSVDSAQPVGERELKYRPDIDGLRAVAVLAVVAFHTVPDLAPGGFAGVDVFFVISGYLISGIILHSLNRGRFSLLDFYARRAKRIFPALIVVLLAVWAFGWLILLPDENARLGKHVAAGAGFALNLLAYRESFPYFGKFNPNPLIHLWSLGVEEQFYLAWPLFIAAIWRFKAARWVMLAVTAASFITNVAAARLHPLAAFYLLPTRLWELSAGGLLTCMESGQLKARHGGQWQPGGAGLALAASQAAGWAGIALLALSFWGLNANMTFPGWWALLPSAGALLLLSAGPASWVNRFLLSRKSMVFIGLISYPLYLWHYPLLAFARIMEWQRFTPLLAMGAVAVAAGLAILTYKFVERPGNMAKLTRLHVL